jgi:hypothetical protein
MAPSVCTLHSLAIVTHEYHEPAYWEKSYAMTNAVVDASMVSIVCSDQQPKMGLFGGASSTSVSSSDEVCHHYVALLAIFLCRWFVAMFTAGRQAVAKYQNFEWSFLILKLLQLQVLCGPLLRA